MQKFENLREIVLPFFRKLNVFKLFYPKEIKMCFNMKTFCCDSFYTWVPTYVVLVPTYSHVLFNISQRQKAARNINIISLHTKIFFKFPFLICIWFSYPWYSKNKERLFVFWHADIYRYWKHTLAYQPYFGTSPSKICFGSF